MVDRCEYAISTIQAYLNSDSLEVRINAIFILGLIFSKLKCDEATSNLKYRIINILVQYMKDSKCNEIRLKSAEALTNIDL